MAFSVSSVRRGFLGRPVTPSEHRLGSGVHALPRVSIGLGSRREVRALELVGLVVGQRDPCALRVSRPDRVVRPDDRGGLQQERPVADLVALDALQRTIYVSGFSKILAPGWRVGYLAAPPDLVEEIRAAETARFAAEKLAGIWATTTSGARSSAPRCP